MNFRPGSNPNQRYSPMAQAKRKNTTAFAKTADDKLFKLHDAFVKAYETMHQYERN